MAVVKTLEATHPHMQTVSNFCERQGDVAKIQLPGDVNIYPFSKYMTVFSHNGKAYAVSGLPNPFKQLWNGQIRDISRTKPADIAGLGLEHDATNNTLQQGKPLTPEECRALWKDMGFTPVDVLRLLDRHLPLYGELAKKAIEGAGLKFVTRDEAKHAFEDAGVFKETSVSRILDEMFEH